MVPRAVLRLLAGLLAGAALFPGNSGAQGSTPGDSGSTQPPTLALFSVVPAQPCNRDSVFVQVMGYVSTPCDSFGGAEVIGPGRVRIRRTEWADRRCFAGPFKYFPILFNFGLFPSGEHAFLIELETTIITGNTATLDREEAKLPFQVSPFCPPDSLPPPGLLPYVQSVTLGRPGPCGPVGDVICPGESISVVIQGGLPNTCFTLKRIVLLPNPSARPSPMPPIIQIQVDDRGCLDVACAQHVVFFTAELRLPPLPPGSYPLSLQLVEQTCTDSVLPARTHFATLPFTVLDACPPGAGKSVCVRPGWLKGTGSHAGCDAALTPGGGATLLLGARSGAALAGLQGAFQLTSPGIRIVQLEAVGEAAGMHLAWNAGPSGARFVLVAGQGAPIAAAPDSGSLGPILRLTLEAPAGMQTQAATQLVASEFLGADSSGNAVPECGGVPCVTPVSGLPGVFDPAVATICLGDACDFNGDGAADIRDLVQMVRCIRGEGPCPDSAASRFDCDSNARFDLDDVLCCARHILILDPCAECVGDSGAGRPEPGIRLRSHPIVSTAAGFEWSLHLDGADRFAGARLDVRFPSRLYRLEGVTMTGSSPASWLELHQADGDRLHLGLIRTAPSVGASPGLDLELRFALVDGAEPGGDLAMESGEFSGPDGARLAVAVPQSSQSLGGQARFDLSGNQPNPFSGTTRFSLTLGRASQLEVSIFDVHGRLQRVLFQGSGTAGVREFTWDGRRQDGSPAPSGLYFCRAASPERVTSRKLMLVRKP